MSRYRLKAPMSAILDKPEGQYDSVTIPAGAVLLDSLHTSTTLLGMVGKGSTTRYPSKTCSRIRKLFKAPEAAIWTLVTIVCG